MSEDLMYKEASGATGIGFIAAFVMAGLTIVTSLIVFYKYGIIFPRYGNFQVNWVILISLVAACLYSVLFACLYISVQKNGEKIDRLIKHLSER